MINLDSRQEQDLIEYAQRAKYEVVGIWKETASGFSSKLLERGDRFSSTSPD